MSYFFDSLLYLIYSLISLIYFKRLNLNTKQKRRECGRTSSRFQIGQNGSWWLSRKSKTVRFGLPSSRWLDTTKEQETEENGVQEERRPQLWRTVSCGACIFGIIPCNFSLSFPVLRHVATCFYFNWRASCPGKFPAEFPHVGNIELPCLLPSAACGHVEGRPCMLGDKWIGDLMKEHCGAVPRTWAAQALPSLRSQLPSAVACGAKPALS